MTETTLQRALRLSRDNGYYGYTFVNRVCPICGNSTVTANRTGGYCYYCHRQIDIDEVMDHE